jgi:hypothetical protein
VARAVVSQVGSPATAQSPPWWTEADSAELDALVYALVDGIYEHRPRCASCAGISPCPHIRKAVESVADWCRWRELQSRARWLRKQRELLEYERDVIRHRASA